MRNCFQQGGSLQDLRNAWLQINSTFHDPGALGNFAENHDQPRWLLGNSDVTTYQNALVMTFMSPGVPIAYYGELLDPVFAQIFLILSRKAACAQPAR
jgi:alpha-amylase